MKIVDMPRGTGKTFQLLCKQKKTGVPILVYTDSIKKALYGLYKETFKDMKILSLSEYLNLSNKPQKIYIDDVFCLLQALFPLSKIDICTFSSEDYVENIKFLLKGLDLKNYL